MKNLKLLFLTVISGSLFVVSCSKKGDTGPAGKTGAAGPDSVIYSAPMTLNMSFDGDYTYYDSLAVPALTKAAVDKDLILGYLKVQLPSGDSTWIDLDAYGGAALGASVQRLTVLSFDEDLTGTPFRFVIVPANVLASTTDITVLDPTSLKRMPYTQAMTALGIHNPSPKGNIAAATAQ